MFLIEGGFEMKKILFSITLSLLLFSITACENNNNDNIVENTAINQVSDNTAEGIVQTKAGLLQGTNQNNILRYLGVPYAQATERFVPAEEVEGSALRLYLFDRGAPRRPPLPHPFGGTGQRLCSRGDSVSMGRQGNRG